MDRETKMPSSVQARFASPDVAARMAKAFGANPKTVTVELKYRQQVGAFVRTIEQAHKAAAKSTLKFR